MKWISKTKYIEATACLMAFCVAVDRYLERGVHYQVIGQTTLINVELVDDWFPNRYPSAGARIESESTVKVAYQTLAGDCGPRHLKAAIKRRNELEAKFNLAFR